MKTKLYPFQSDCVQEIEAFKGRALVACSMGLGKSIIALSYLHRHPEITRAIVVCPASLKWNWELECKKHFGWRVEVLEGRKPSPMWDTALPRILVINYDILSGWIPLLKGLNPGLVIYDESHYIASRSSLRTRSLRALCEKVPRIIALSGTPLTNRPAELWPTLNVLRPDLYRSFFRFAHLHCAPKRGYWGGWDYSGAARLKTLHHNLKKHLLVRRRKEDVLSQLPPKRHYVIPLEISDSKQYSRAARDFLGWLREKSAAKARRASKAEKMVRTGYLVRLAAELKLKAVMTWVDNFLAESEEKLLLFGVHKNILNPLRERYGEGCILIDGSVVGKKRQEGFERFNKHKKTRLLIGNIDAAGVGWSCRSSSCVAFAEYPWVPGKLIQAMDRAHGLGRGVEGSPTEVWFLTAKGTIEERLCEILQRKQKIIDSTLDGKEAEQGLDVYDLLIKELEGEDSDDEDTLPRELDELLD